MRRALCLALLAASGSCTEKTPPGYVCGPITAYSFPPAKGTQIKVYAPWRARTAVTDQACTIAPGSTLIAGKNDKTYVLVELVGPASEEGQTSCPDGNLLLHVRQWALMAAEGEDVREGLTASDADRADRIKRAQELSSPH